MRNRLGLQQEMFTIGEQEGKDWIEPGETVEFRFSPWLDIERPADKSQIRPDREFTVFLSYFDIDHNEYLTVTKTFIGGRSGLIIVAISDSKLNDSLIALAKDLRTFGSKTYDDLHLRLETGGFSVSGGDSSVVDSGQ